MTKHFKGLLPATLSSRAARKALDHLKVAEFEFAFESIDRMAGLFSGLSQLHQTPDSTRTREAQAQDYARKRQQALDHAETIRRVASERLTARRDKLRADAVEKAGLNGKYPQSEEVRRALRELPQADRDAAIADAIDSGDAWIIGSIRNFPQLLTGKISMGREMIEDLFVDRAAPELREQLGQIATALQSLEFAADSFVAASEEMRDLEAENRADADAKRVSEAEAAFQKALGAAPAV